MIGWAYDFYRIKDAASGAGDSEVTFVLKPNIAGFEGGHSAVAAVFRVWFPAV
jgi:hypothetical protein